MIRVNGLVRIMGRYFGMGEEFFLGLQTDYGLRAKKQKIGEELSTIQPEAA